jgi:hypothetical protein
VIRPGSAGGDRRDGGRRHEDSSSTTALPPTAVRLEVVVRLRDLLERSVSRITLTPASSTAPSTPPGISSRTAGATSPVSMRT